MGIFDTIGKSNGQAPRKPETLKKVKRLIQTVNHQEPDRIAISDSFWGSFIERWRKELNLPNDANPYFYYDLDFLINIPNVDPKIRQFEVLNQTNHEVVVKTGFDAIMRKKFADPMPEQTGWKTDTIEKLEAFEFDDPADRRRFFDAGDNQICGVGDAFHRNTPPWIDVVKSLYADIPLCGSVIECNECLTRLIGQENTMLWIGLYPDRLGKQINRIGQFYFDLAQAQIRVANGLLDGFMIWGDVAYKNGLFFSPDYWRTYFKPWVKAIAELCHKHDLPVMYHGCGNVSEIFEDYIEAGIDVYNPLEAKAGNDVVELRRRYGHRITFYGNSNIQIWETGDKKLIKKEVLRKLNAAKGGGYIFASDHSVASNISGKTYDYIVKLVREYGNYPLNLDEFDEKT